MPVITVTPVGDICLYPGTTPVDLEVTIVNGNNGTGGWAGPGVTDPVNGTFDPNVAGAGAHNICYNYSEDGCDFSTCIVINVYDVPDAVISNNTLIITCATNTLVLHGQCDQLPMDNPERCDPQRRQYGLGRSIRGGHVPIACRFDGRMPRFGISHGHARCRYPDGGCRTEPNPHMQRHRGDTGRDVDYGTKHHVHVDDARRQHHRGQRRHVDHGRRGGHV
jgi:hypothetical protein